jgi:hypothetical protein
MALKSALSTVENIDPVESRSGDRQNTLPLRVVAVVGLLGIALIHLLDLPGKIAETPYLGWAFIALIIASLALAAVLATRDDRAALLAAGGLATAVIIGYVINRTVGMPGAMDDIGNWGEPLGVASLFVEGTVVLVVLPRLRRR